jgi:GT2 family glycosyltransferase
MIPVHVGVSIVNYKTASLVIECLRAIATNCRYSIDISVCVVDNNSQDGSFEILREFVEQAKYSSWVHIIAAVKNGGFSYGNNIAANYFLSKDIDYLWLLNPDTEPKKGSIEALVAALKNEPKCSIAGSRLEDSDGTVQVAAFNFPTPFGEFVNTMNFSWLFSVFPSRVVAGKLPQSIAKVDWTSGASMLIRWSEFVKFGPMDEKYFLYFEEVDFCMALKTQGFDTLYVPESRVMHHVGAATGISDTRKQAPKRPRYWFESRVRFFTKNYGLGWALIADLCWVAGYILMRLKAFLKRTILLEPPNFLWDFIRYSTIVQLLTSGRTLSDS